MKKWLAGPAVAGMLLVGSASTVDASSAPAQEETVTEDDSSKVGLLGLIGLAGLAGLAGLKRRDDRGYDRRDVGASRRTP
jgi:MYXO-CTERM domain-containing protein